MEDTPKYYIGKYKQIEAFDVCLDFQEDNYNLSTAITYLLRAGNKPNNPITQDIRKAIAHLERELKHQNDKKSRNFEYFDKHNASATSKLGKNGMAILHEQREAKKN